jgi:acetyl esterase/lipase
MSQQAAGAPEPQGPHRTLSYGPHADHVADITFPPDTAAGPRPLVLFWHGGFWRAEHDRRHVGAFVAAIAQEGYVVANVEFRRIGAGGGWPTTFIDVGQAADLLPALIEREWPGATDLDRVIYAGHSAGGHLASWAASRHRLPLGAPGRTSDRPRVAGVIGLAPVTDLVHAHRLGSDSGAVDALLGGGPESVPERYAATDPAALAPPSSPVVLIHGDRDGLVPIDMSHRYAAATGCRLVELPGLDHFALIDRHTAAWPALLEALGALSTG